MCSEHEGQDGVRKEGKLDDNYSENVPYKSRRRNSETRRVQYINNKELRICVGTWNVGGKLPSDDLDIDEWLVINEQADIYVLGLQEIVPLNAGNIFGAEDSRPAQRWESVIRRTLNRIESEKPKYKCYSDPPSPSRFKPSDDALNSIDDLQPGTDSDTDDEVHPMDEQSINLNIKGDGYSTIIEDSECSVVSSCTSNADATTPQEIVLHKWSAFNRSDSRHNLSSFNNGADLDISIGQQKELIKTLSSSEKIGLVWPEKPLNFFANCAFANQRSFKSATSFKACNSFKSVYGDYRDSSDIGLIPDLNLDAIICRRKMSSFVRIISKQMVGIFLSIWVRRGLRKHIQNLKVRVVGVGAMGYIGNKGSISVSMSIYQTLFCFICSHLSSGEKAGDELRRNADVQEIHRRTHFSTAPSMGLPKNIHDHERIFWLGDLNYRINLSNEKTHELILKKDWSQLVERDQLKRELKKGRAFDGWSEGILNFPPTYKYEFNSEKYIREDLKTGRRTPAWCDRILSFGRGIALINYKRSELRLSDHRPVTAFFTAEVEVFSHRKLQRALTFTDAEIEEGEIIPDMEMDVALGHLRLGKDIYQKAR